MWHLTCEHALAAALNLGITFDYLVEEKRKFWQAVKAKTSQRQWIWIQLSKKKGLKKSQIQNKCNKEMKSATSERQRFAVASIFSKTLKGPSASDKVISAGDI